MPFAPLAPPLALVALSAASTAWAQAVTSDRPVVPSAGIATESGPAMLWVNPANMAYDHDPRYAVLLGHDFGDSPTSLAITTGLGGFSVGVHHVALPDGGDWSIDYATSLALPKRFAVGARFGWHLVHDGQNYVGYDLAGSWRPLPWIGAGVTARNVGAAGEARAPANSGFGVALRPFGDALVLGYEYARTFATVDADGVVAAGGAENLLLNGRLRPVEGLYLRGHVGSVLPDGAESARLTAGAGVELYFGGVGGGVFGAVDSFDALSAPADGGTGGVAWIGTDEPGEALVRSGRRVPVLDLTTPPAYQPTNGLFETPRTSWLETLELLDRAGDDRGVRGVLVEIGGVEVPWGLAQELRGRLESLRARGKVVVAYLHGSATTRDYFVASAADHIVLHPAQHLALTGVQAELVHVRGALDLVGVKPEFVRRSAYKSAVDQLTEVVPTPEELEAENAVLDDLYAVLVDEVSAGRHVDRAQVEEWIAEAPWAPGSALRAGLVDAVLYPDQLYDLVNALVPGEVLTYDLAERDARGASPWEAPQQIAVVYIEGAIAPGESAPPAMFSGPVAGAATVVDELRRAALDPQVRAIVVRVDSPGGSVFASDEIHRAMVRAKDSGKPVVVSMGAVAASGGYYVAAPADAIWAEPTTLTGSIGVFTGKFAVQDALERVGVTTTTLARGRMAGLDGTGAWDPAERARMERQVDETYALFKDKVRAGRGLTPEQVEAAAQGRVWTGRRAADLGLVDELGSLQDAIADARDRAGIPLHLQVAVVSVTERGTLIEALAPAMTRAALPVIQRATGRGAPISLADLGVPAAVGAWLQYARLGDDVLVWDPVAEELAGR